jgi:tetratricopeptide (TPR) repeat protein
MESPKSNIYRLLAPAAVCLALAGLPLHVARAAGSDSEQARSFFDKATASFALGRYPVAADNFEKAFELKPDPALLYNAAQAHRLAGDKERALVLYQNYLRLYAKAGRRSEVETRIEDLKKAIEHDHQVANSPPTTTMPSSVLPAVPTFGAEPAPAPAPPPPSPTAGTTFATSPAPAPAPPVIDIKPAAPAPAPILIGRSEATATDNRSLTQKPLFWAAVGGGVAAAIVVVLVVALSGAKDPSPSLGIVR